MTPRNVVLEGDALEMLRGLRPHSIDAVMTSPPYFQARAYDAGPKEFGREPHVDEWVASLREVCQEIARVFKPTGSLWLNVGDLYSRHAKLGAPPKSLLLAPERLVQALLVDGWVLRNKVAWVKSTPLPSPVLDRLTNGWEPVFHLVRQGSYFYDLDAIRIPLVSKSRGSMKVTPLAVLGPLAGPRIGLQRLAAEGRAGHPLGKNPSDVWIMPPGRSVRGHYATFSEALVRRPILATVPEHICTDCGRAWLRSRRRVTYLERKPQTRPLVPCGCDAPTRPGIVLDPFVGSSTTLRVARMLGRDGLGIELSPAYAQVARERAGYVLEAAR